VSVLGVWQPAEVTDWVPNNAGSVQIGLLNWESGAGDFRVHHDGVCFGPNPDAVFGDDFESADVSGWDNAVGYPWFGAYDDCGSAACNAGLDCIVISGINHNQPEIFP